MAQIVTFRHNGKTYASIGNHTWQMLEGLSYNRDLIFAIVVGKSGSIAQEYLPSNSWKVYRFKVKGRQPLFVIYNSTYFKHSEKFYGKKQAYVAKTTEGCLFLGVKDFLERIGVESTDRNIAKTVPMLTRKISTLTQEVDGQSLVGRMYDYSYFYAEDDMDIVEIKEVISGRKK